MKCRGNFVFKSLNKQDGGEFTNDKGQNIKFNGSYVLKVDEITDKGPVERKLKFDLTNSYLLEKIKALTAYDRIDITCDVVFYNSQVKLVPIDIEKTK